MSQIRDRGVERRSDALSGRRIALGASGGIACVELVKMIRELRRHGAEIFPYFTPAVEQFITPLSVEWAAGRPVVRTLEADVDHLEDYDLVILAPATLNTIAKCAAGICDNPVTLLVAGQLGRRGRVLMVPTMNLQLMRHPAYPEQVRKLESWGVQFFSSPEEEGRLKMPAPEKFGQTVIELFRK